MIAVFDLDKTLISEDSTTLWAHWLCQQKIVKNEKAYLCQENNLMQQYYNQGLNIQKYIEFTLQPVIDLTINKIDRLIASFIETEIKPRIYPESLALVKRHQQKGDEVLIISASASILVKPIAKYCMHVNNAYGIDVEKKQNYYTTNIIGTIPYQEGKIIRLQEHIKFFHSYFANTCFYSDSINDIPLLSAVEYPCVINPDKKLEVLAVQKNWPILYFKE